MDWSQSQVSYTVTRDSYRAGAVVKTGQLVLNRNPNNPASLNTRVNPITFRPGRLINVELWNGAAWAQHPMFPVRNSVKPIPPAWNENLLTLDLTCELGYYLNLPEPDEEKLVIPAGGTMPYHTAVQNLLEAGQVPPANIDLPSAWSNHELNFSPPKEGGSWVQMAIDLAEVENQCLYTDSRGIIVSKEVNVNPSSATLSINADSETIDYRPYQEVAAPPHKVTVYGNGRAVDSQTGQVCNTFTVYGNLSGLIENASGRGIISRITECETVNEVTFTDNLGSERTITNVTRTRTLWKKAGFVSEKISPAIQLIKAEEETTESLFDSQGLMFRETKTVREPQIAINPDEEDLQLQLRDSSKVTQDWDISNEQYVEGIRTVVEKSKVRIYPDTEDAYTLQKAQFSDRNWRQKAPERYVYWATEQIPLYLAQPEKVEDEADAYKLVGDPNFVPPTEDLPPAPRTLDSALSENDEQFTGIAEFTEPGGADVRERTYEETLAGYCVSSEQCENNAKTKGAMLWGRNLGSELTIGYRAALLAQDSPLWRIDVIEPAIVDYRDPTGTTLVEKSYRQSFLTDSETWEHTREGLDIAFLGIWIGTSDNAITAPSANPYVQPIIVGTAVVVTDKSLFGATPALAPGTTVYYQSSANTGNFYYEFLEYIVVDNGANPATWGFVMGIVAASTPPAAPYAAPLGVGHEWRVIDAGNSQVTEIWLPNGAATAWIQEF